MAKLSKSNIYAIQWLSSQGMSAADIASELKLSENQVNNHIAQTQQPTPNPATDLQNPKNLMITQTSGKGTNTVAIMTKQASELGDELKKQHTQPKSNTGIFRPRS